MDLDLFFQTLAEAFQEDSGDVAYLVFLERFEDDDVVNTVEKFRTEVLFEQFADFRIGFVVVLRFEDFVRAEVTGHDDDGVLEVDHTAFAIGQAAIVEDLQQDVEDIRMGLFDFIEEDDAVRTTTDGFRELAPFIIADISRRSPDQTGYGMLFHVFRHIDADDVAFVIEEGFRQGLGQFGLADTGRAEEDEGTNRTVRVFDTGTGTDDGIADDADGIVLADDPFMQRFVEVQEFFPFAGHHLGDRDAGPAADDLGDIFFADFFFEELRILVFRQVGFLFFQLFLQFRQFAVLQFRSFGQIVVAFGLGHVALDGVDFFLQALRAQDGLFFFIPLGFELAFFFFQFVLRFRDLSQPFFGSVVRFFVQGLFFNFQLHDLMAQFVNRRRHGFDFRTQFSGGFVDEVDGLIRQEAVGNVAVRQDSGSDQGFITDADAMMDFVTFFQATENGDRVFDRRLVDHDRLETTFQSGIFFDVFLVFIEGRSADAAQVTTGQHRFQDVAGVHGAFRSASADDGVDFIDEEENLAVRFGDFIEDRFESFFKFATVFGTGDEGAHIEGVEGLVLQRFRNVAADDTAGQSFDDSRLADARFTDEDRVVLTTAGQDFDGTADFIITADDRVQFVLAGSGGQIAAVFFQGLVVFFGVIAVDVGLTVSLDGTHDFVLGQAKFTAQLLDFVVAFADDTHEDVFRADVFIVHGVG